MSGHNGHKLRKLQQRLSKRRLEARREKNLKGGTWRQDMVNNLNLTFANISKVVNRNQEVNDKRNKSNIILFAVNGFLTLGMLGRCLGWW